MLQLRVTGRTTLVDARISKLLEPWTLSAVMIVDILAHPEAMNIPDRAFLKLYDRRFATQVRRHWDMPDWSPKVEEELIDFSRTGKAQSFLQELRKGFSSDEIDDWGIVENEADASQQMVGYLRSESEAYHSLRHHQGSLIPRLYGEVTFQTKPQDDLGQSPELFDVPGILLEYIDGFRLSDLAKHTEQTEWNYLVNRAVEVTGEVLNLSNVLNQDVRPENMMVCRDPSYERGYRLVMVDFGICEFRADYDSLEEWGRAKAKQDEGGALGMIMKAKLQKQAGFVAEYKHQNPISQSLTQVRGRGEGTSGAK